jgi:beta-galactosidase
LPALGINRRIRQTAYEMLGRIFFVACVLVLTGSPVAAHAFQIKKLLPVTTSDSVRIELAFQCDGTDSKVALDGVISDKITHKVLWKGNFISTRDFGDAGPGSYAVTNSIGSLKPSLWSPASPNLYELKVTATRDKTVLTNCVFHIGFRSFESSNGQLYLNDRPIFLRGLAINPPGRTVPYEVGESRAFAEAYVRFMKSQNVNIIRLTHDSQVWFDVCDELGMLIYQGQYGSPLGSEAGKSRPPVDFEKSIAAYHSLFETYAKHPSIVIYILSNELPVSGSRGKAYHDFLTSAHAALKQWDSTRLYIGNAGYGEGREGDICDVHRYWGWYYNTFLTFYNLRDGSLFGDPKKAQPITFSECVGSFTGPSGEFNQIVRKQLGAQLNWTGHSPNQRDDALRYQAFMVQQAAEIFRRLRPINPRLSGLMAFTTLFFNWSGIQSFDQMLPKPAMDHLKTAYQPILLSWELWTPQIYAGTTLHPIAHVINDSDLGTPLTNATLMIELQNANRTTILSSNIALPDIPYYGTSSRKLNVEIPVNLVSDRYRFAGKVMSGGKIVSQNVTELFVAGTNWANQTDLPHEAIYLFDPPGKTAAALRKLHIPFTELGPEKLWPPILRVLIIGEFALQDSAGIAAKLKPFMAQGGRILCLRQSPESFGWLPEPVSYFTASANQPSYLPTSRPFGGNMNINPERPDHPVFRGLDRLRLELWSDYTGWDQTKPGFPQIYPVTAGFALKNSDSLARTAVLADYDRGLEGIALCEMFTGKGSVILSAFDLVARSGLDPVADRLLENLVQYVGSSSGHDVHPLITEPIEWGNYASEHGVIVGPANGFVVNADWVKPVTNPSAKQLTQTEGAWNIRPGDQFVPHGRSPFGPYGYSTGSSLKDLNPGSAIGTATFWIRIPADKSSLTTLVENRSISTASLTVGANEKSQDFPLPPNKATRISIPIQAGTSDLRLQYRGDKKLVILETAFE